MPEAADDELRQTSVVVLVPEAEGLVGGGAKGPAHVTVLHPFLERAVICGEVLRRVERVVTGTGVPGVWDTIAELPLG